MSTVIENVNINGKCVIKKPVPYKAHCISLTPSDYRCSLPQSHGCRAFSRQNDSPPSPGRGWGGGNQKTHCHTTFPHHLTNPLSLSMSMMAHPSAKTKHSIPGTKHNTTATGTRASQPSVRPSSNSRLFGQLSSRGTGPKHMVVGMHTFSLCHNTSMPRSF